MALVLSGDGSITGNPDITLTESVSIAGTVTYEDVTSIDSVGIITARSGIKVTGGNIDAGDILNAVGGVRTNVDGSVVINPASSTPDHAHRFILYKDRSANTDTSVVFTKVGRADFAGRVFSNEWFQSDRTDGTNSAFYATVSGTEKLNIRANGSASFAAGAFAIESDGDISTNVRCHGHIELDSSGVFTTPTIKLFSNSGNANFAGEINVGGYNGSSATTDGVLLGAVGGVYSQLTAATASSGVLWQGMHGSTYTSRITAGGDVHFAGRVDIGDELGVAHAGQFQVIHTGGGQQANDALSFFETNAQDWIIMTNYNTTGTHYHMRFMAQGSVKGAIYGSSGADVQYQGGSDYRWKENIVEITGTQGIDICKKLKPSYFNWIENRIQTGEINTVDGFIAHEVQEAGLLGVVSGEKDAVNEDGSINGQMMDYGKMTPVLSAAIKGLIDKVETLEQRLSDAGL